MYTTSTILTGCKLLWTQGQEEVMDLLQAAPFQNMYPRPFVKGVVDVVLVFVHL